MDIDAKLRRRRHLFIALPTGFLAACMVFVVMGIVQAASDDTGWLLALIPALPLLVILCRTSAGNLNAAMHPEEEPPPSDRPLPPENEDA